MNRRFLETILLAAGASAFLPVRGQTKGLLIVDDSAPHPVKLHPAEVARFDKSRIEAAEAKRARKAITKAENIRKSREGMVRT